MWAKCCSIKKNNLYKGPKGQASQRHVDCQNGIKPIHFNATPTVNWNNILNTKMSNLRAVDCFRVQEGDTII